MYFDQYLSRIPSADSTSRTPLPQGQARKSCPDVKVLSFTKCGKKLLRLSGDGQLTVYDFLPLEVEFKAENEKLYCYCNS